MKLPKNSADNGAGSGCMAHLVRHSSFLARCCDLLKLCRKRLALAAMFVTAYAAINVGICHGGRESDGFINLTPALLEVGSAQIEISQNLSDGLIKGGSRGNGSVRSIGVDQLASPLRDCPTELPATDLRLPIKDGFLGSNVSLLGEVMSQDGSNHNADQSPEHVCPWCEGRQIGIVHQIGYHVFVVLAAMGLGIPIVYWLVQKDFFLPNA